MAGGIKTLMISFFPKQRIVRPVDRFDVVNLLGASIAAGRMHALPVDEHADTLGMALPIAPGIGGPLSGVAALAEGWPLPSGSDSRTLSEGLENWRSRWHGSGFLVHNPTTSSSLHEPDLRC